MTGIIGAEVHSGVGSYDKHVPAMRVAKLVVANNNIWILLVNITKLSILVQYLRIFSCRIVRILCVILMLLLLPAVFWGIFGGTFLCTPTAKLWNPSLAGHCMSAQQYWYSVAGIDISLDFLILVLPLPAITRLRLPRKQKVGLVLVFLLGFFVCVVSVVRVATVLVISLEHDYVASGIWAIVWSAVEANVGIVCASLLALKPLVVELCPSLMTDDEPPKHSMRLPRIEDQEKSPECDLDKAALAHARSCNSSSSPLSPSKESQCFSRPGTGKTVSTMDSVSAPRGPQANDGGTIAAGGCFSAGVGEEQLYFFDMLQQSAMEVRGGSRRG